MIRKTCALAITIVMLLSAFTISEINSRYNDLYKENRSLHQSIEDINCLINSSNPNIHISQGHNISYIKLHKLLLSHFKNVYIFTTDREYSLIKNISEIRKFLSIDNTNTHKYINDEFDCDDFAIQLLSRFHYKNSKIAVGIMFVMIKPKYTGHAVNFFIDENLNIWIIEPQNDNVYPFDYNRFVPYLILI